MPETRVRSIVKALSWRIVASSITIGIALLAGIDTKLAFGIVIIDFMVKIGVYYIHERVWLSTNMR